MITDTFKSSLIFVLYNFKFTLIMKHSTFYPYNWSHPYIWCHPSFLKSDLEEGAIKELILKNNHLLELGVAEMHLNLKKLTVIDNTGMEHPILDFKGQTHLKIKGIGSGHFLRSKSIVNLKPNTYNVFRFYLRDSGNQFTYRDNFIEAANKFEYIDFEIENGLSIEDNQASEMKIWFELATFDFSRHFKPLVDWLKKTKITRPQISSYIN